MLFTAQGLGPQIAPKTYACAHMLIFQVRGPGTIFLGTEQGEVASLQDGIMITQATTQTPWYQKWRGDLWYNTDTPGQQFIILDLGEEYP